MTKEELRKSMEMRESKIVGWIDRPLENEVLTEIIIMSASTILAAFLIVFVFIHIFSEWIRRWGEVL